MLFLSSLPKHSTLIVLAITFLLSACDNNTDHKLTEIAGSTMGTSWSVKIVDLPSHIEETTLKSALETELQAINNSMSTYVEESEISRLNKHKSNSPFPVSENLYYVLSEALDIAQISNGAFDITVGPLVNLWGFGPIIKPDQVPDESEILATLAHTGKDKISLQAQPQAVIKIDPNVYLDLSAIAKGYAVDRLAAMLEHKDIQNYMVDIGGELKLRGINPRGIPWVIAVEKPDPNTRSALQLIQPERAAIATSGDYRNYFEQDGIRYSHTIDPATGKPISHKLASVSVINKSCVAADALATAIMVMGPEKGLEFAKQHDLAVLFVVKVKDGFNSIATNQFKPYIK